jgi:ATP phosphoribosyltransferase regulatory subunit HisZ
MALLEALELDEDQQQALRDALGEPERPEPPAPLDLEAFAEDDFEAASLGLAELHAAHVTERATKHVALVEALVPLLDDEQRATLEDLLRDAPPEPTRSARG